MSRTALLARLPLVGLLLLPLPALAQPAVTKAEDIESGKVCQTCHQDTHLVWSGKHGVKGDPRTPAAGGGCAACHGDPSAHLKDPATAKPRSFGPTVSPGEKNQVCTNCHQGGSHIFWTGGTHERNDVACVDCHKPHAAKDQVLVAETQAGVCFTCHKDVRAQLFRPSVHPLRTGRMACTACHAPHGSTAPHQMVKNTINDTCYSCHAEKRGPFLWEHPPAREDCAECHQPHGAVHAPLLKARGPFLCQQCHLAQFHPSTNYSGANIPRPGAPTGAFDKMLGQNCMNCHPKVHGTNHPSGAFFTR